MVHDSIRTLSDPAAFDPVLCAYREEYSSESGRIFSGSFCNLVSLKNFLIRLFPVPYNRFLWLLGAVASDYILFAGRRTSQ